MLKRSHLVVRSVAVCSVIGTIGCAAPTITARPVASRAAPAPVAPPPALAPKPAPMTHATAVVRDPAGTRVGTVNFTDSYAGLIVAGTLANLGLGSHGIHIHEFGKCEAPFLTAGGHFNPTHRQHGFRNPNGPHLGDLPNINTPAAGALKFEFVLPNVTLTGNNALLDADGASIVVHEGRDDYATDPAGNSGGRIACGVITR